MNIQKPEDCTEQWERDLQDIENNPDMPAEEKVRVVYEIDTLYNSMYAILVHLGQKEAVDQMIRDTKKEM